MRVPSPGGAKPVGQSRIDSWLSARVLRTLGKVALGGATPAGTAFNPQVHTGSFIKTGLLQPNSWCL